MCNQCREQELELLPEYLANFNDFESEFFPELELELIPEVTGTSRESAEYIKWVQDSLNHVLGINLKVDGIMGAMTRSAIRSFQKQNGLTADGIIGPKTEKDLRVALAKGGIFPNDTSQSTTSGNGLRKNSANYIKWVQATLNQLLGLKLSVDGKMGPMTRSALKSFQKQKGLVVDGIVGPQTERALGAAVGAIGPKIPLGNLSPSILAPQSQQPSLLKILDNLLDNKSPLPGSLNAELEKAVRRFVSILQRQKTLSPDRTRSLICRLNKLLESDVDDRFIAWCAIRPTTSQFSPERVQQEFSNCAMHQRQSFPISETFLFNNIRTENDIERVNEKLRRTDPSISGVSPFISHLKVQILYLHVFDYSEDLLPEYLQNLDWDINSASLKLYLMNFEWGDAPKYYVAIINWIGHRQTDSKSIYSCGKIDEDKWF